MWYSTPYKNCTKEIRDTIQGALQVQHKEVIKNISLNTMEEFIRELDNKLMNNNFLGIHYNFAGYFRLHYQRVPIPMGKSKTAE